MNKYEELKRELESRGLKVREEKVHKMNETLDAFIIEKESGICPTFYPSLLFEDGYSVEKIADMIVGMSDEAPFQDEDSIFESSDNLSLRILDVRRNEDFLKNIPYEPIEGTSLGVIAEFVLDNFRTVVSNDVLECKLGMEKDTVFKVAAGNCAHKARLVDMQATLFGEPENLLGGNGISNPKMLVLSNEDGVYGASSIYFGTVRSDISRMIGPYYVLPSSVHEVIIVPEIAGISVDELRDMVRSANDTVVAPRDILSYDVYHVSENGRIEVA